MKCSNDYSRCSCFRVCLVVALFLLHSGRGQIHSLGGANGVPLTGVPLPILRDSQGRSRASSAGSSDLLFQRANGATPFDASRPPPPAAAPDAAAAAAAPAGPLQPSTLDAAFPPAVGGPLDPRAGRTLGRGLGSLHHIEDPSQDEGVRALLTHPAVRKKIQQETSGDSAVKVDSVITAHRQVVSGEITYLDVKVVETKCSIGTANVETCEVDSTEDPHICEVAVWRRPWLDSVKVIDEKTRCAEIENDNDFRNWNKGANNGRNHNAETVLTSLPPFLDENQLALEAFDYINRGSESKFTGQMINHRIAEMKHDPVLNITTVEVEVEYGFTLCLKFPNRKVDDRICPLDGQRDHYICSVKVMSDPNLTTNLKVIPGDDDDIDCEKRHPVEEELVVPVKAVCMGCPQTVSLNDPSVQKIAEFAVTEYDRTSDDSELHMLLKLHKAQTQVVRGIKYYLTMEIAETDCDKRLSAVNMNRTLCNRDHTEETEICDVIVLEQPWQKSMEMVSVYCTDKSNYPASHRDEFIIPVLGGAPSSGSGFVSSAPKPLPAQVAVGSPPDPLVSPTSRVQDSVDLVLSEFNRREVEDYDDGFYKVIKIIDASTTHEGTDRVDHVVIELGETVCTRTRSTEGCPLKIGEDVEICAASVLKSNPAQILYMSCDDKDDHHHLTLNPVVSPFESLHQPFFLAQPGMLGLPGGPVEQSTADPETMDLARFVVDQYNLQSSDDELHKLNRVISSYTQVVSAQVNYILELELLETECKKYQPVDDVAKCPVELNEDPKVCQAEVSVSPSRSGEKPTKFLGRLYCDERETFYIKKKTESSGASGVRPENWTAEDVSSEKVKQLGHLIADEFDFRSDEDNIFVLFKVLESKTEGTGLTHQLKVDLAQTVCPKYKQKINKTRCIVDIGEEHKICEAEVSERPWKKDHEVRDLWCFERDDSAEENESREVLYPRVHPSAHARPKFIQSRFRMRQHSGESDESNEKYYRMGGALRSQGRDVDSDEHDLHDDDDVINRRRFDDVIGRGHTDDVTSRRRYDDDVTSRQDDDVTSRHRYDDDVTSRHRYDDDVTSRQDDDVTSRRRYDDDVTSRQDDDVTSRHRYSRRFAADFDLDDDEGKDSDHYYENDSRSLERFGRAAGSRFTGSSGPGSRFTGSSATGSHITGSIGPGSSATAPLRRLKRHQLEIPESDLDALLLEKRIPEVLHMPESNLPKSGTKSGLPDDRFEIAEFALLEADLSSDDDQIRVVEKVISAKKQNAINKDSLRKAFLWKMEIEAAFTDCTKLGILDNLTDCRVDARRSRQRCDIEVLTNVVHTEREVRKFKCHNIRSQTS